MADRDLVLPPTPFRSWSLPRSLSGGESICWEAWTRPRLTWSRRRKGSSWLIPAFKATRGRSNRRWHGSGSIGGACAPSCSRTFTETIAEGLNTCAATGARVFAGLGDAAVLRAGGPREAVFSTFYRPNDQPHPTTVDVELKGGESIAFGDVTFHALAMPGHTPGSICYLMDAPISALYLPATSS